MFTSLSLGDRVNWETLSGTSRGTIVGMRLEYTETYEIIPWITVEYDDKYRKFEFRGIKEDLEMFDFIVL